MLVNNYNRIAVIAAGGYSMRMPGLPPKSLLKVNDVTYLEILLDEISMIGFDSILIYCNRQDFIKIIERLSLRYANCHVLFDNGANSTFELVRLASSYISCKEVFFFYGHSPRKADDILKLLRHNSSTVVSLYHNSSKNCLIKTENGLFIEPPYKILISEIGINSFSSWKEFFNSIKYGYVEYDTPNEFNYLYEELVYRNYAFKILQIESKCF